MDSAELVKGKMNREWQGNESFSPAWYFLLLPTVGDEVWDQRSALGVSCSWETLGEGSTAPPAGPAWRTKGCDPLGKVSPAGQDLGLEG